MGTDYHARVIIGFEATPEELALSEMPAHHCPKGHIRKGAGDKFCPTCGGTFEKDPKPPMTLIERYAKAHKIKPEEQFDEWHDGDPSGIALRRVCSLDSSERDDGPMVLGKILCETGGWGNRGDGTTPINFKEIEVATEELYKIKHDLGWDDRPIRQYLVLYASI